MYILLRPERLALSFRTVFYFDVKLGGRIND